MKPITLHPVSVLAGLALAGLVVLATGAAQAIATLRPIVVGVVPADQWTYFKIQDSLGVPSYTVPSDRYLVVTRLVSLAGPFTGLTRNGVNCYEQFAAVGAQVTSASAWSDVGNTRVVLQPGDLLSGTGGYVINVWGYLEPVR